MRKLRSSLLLVAAVFAALGLWGLWTVRYACTDPHHGCAMMIPGALLCLVLALGLGFLATVVWLIERARARARAV